MAIALDGDDYSLDGAAERLAALAGADRLIPRDWEAPVLVCLDYQAAALKMSGRNLEVILPREGTLTLTRGIACRTPLAFPADLPDRPISPHPNLVTANGLARIEQELAEAKAAYTAAQAKGSIEADRTAMARATRDLRYWSARRANAQLVERPGLRVVDMSAALTQFYQRHENMM